jgi:UTP--glucose-1-phosphate uridylyltransferase
MNVRKAIFPVAGLGTRFLPATKATPKEMLPIVDKPLIQYAVEEAVDAGLTDLIFVTSYTKRAIEDHFDRQFELESKLAEREKLELLKLVTEVIPKNINCVYIRQREALGLGHAVLQAKDIVGNNPFCVILADDLIKNQQKNCLTQMIELHDRFPANILAVEEVPKEQTSSYGIIAPHKQIDHYYEVNGIIEKPEPQDAPSNLAVIGRYVLQPEIFSFLEEVQPDKGGEIQLTAAIAAIMQYQKVFGLRFAGKRYDCGSKLGFLQAQVDFGLENKELSAQFADFLQHRLSTH